MEPEAIKFSIAKNVKKGVVHAATYLVGVGAAWLAAQGFELTPEQKSMLILALAGAIGSGLTMARNWLKVRWPEAFGWL